jgi:hypothetical protein
MIEFFLARRVLANLLTLFLSVEGAFAFMTTRWEMIPEFTYFTVMIERVIPDDCGHGSLVGFPDASPHGRVFYGSRPSSMNNTGIPYPFSRGASLAVPRS